MIWIYIIMYIVIRIMIYVIKLYGKNLNSISFIPYFM